MTREDAFEIWLPIIKMGVKSMPECYEALEIAIASLEAWGRVKDDIHEYETDCMVSADCQDCKDCNVAMFKSIYHIIDKHLQEVAE